MLIWKRQLPLKAFKGQEKRVKVAKVNSFYQNLNKMGGVVGRTEW